MTSPARRSPEGRGLAARGALARLLNVQGIPHAFTFSLLQGILILAVSVPFTVIPLRALALLGDAQQVSAFYLGVGVVSLAGALGTPLLIQAIGRRRSLAAGALAVLVAAPMFLTDSVVALFVATALYTLGFFASDIAMNVAIMERIPRQQFIRFEALRMACLGAGFTLGPWLGVVLAEGIGLWVPFAVMVLCATGSSGYALAAGLVANRSGLGAGRANPLRFIPRFLAQPRLRLAYLLAVLRSMWWSVFFVYAPIYCVESGFTNEDAGMVVSLGAAAVMLTPLWSRLGAPLGMRRFLALSYAATGCVALVMVAFADLPLAGVGLLLGACVCASWIDAVGSAPFVRAVRPLERPEMTSLYTTYRDVGRIVPQGAFAVVLLVLPLSAVFALAGVAMLTASWFSRYIPRRY